MCHSRVFFTAVALTVSILSISQCLYARRGSTPLPGYKVNEYPFNMVGKVSTGGSFSGSGTAISQKIVLAAAHSFFNENNLVWNRGPFGWNLRHSPSNTNFDMTARSYQHFSDYAEATRRFHPGDGNHSWEQFNLDAICLIFHEDVGLGGWAGIGRNKITNNSDKMIVGYPQLNYSYYDPRNHTMHSTSLNGSRAKYTLVNYNDRMGSKRRAYLTDDLSSGPGNSGGPVFGLIDFSTGTDWGVVGITVGGTVGEDSVAVGIDSGVSNLIKKAISDSGVTTPSDDHGDTRNTATKIELNRSVSGNLETEGDIDYFRFVLRDEGTVTISTTGRIDTFGILKNNSGNNIATNDDGGSGENFSITRELKRGTYYIGVSHFSNEETGKYSLRVNFTEAAKLPDLAVDSVRADKRSVVAGESIGVDVRRSNKGDKNSGIFDHGIYLSKDRIITSSDRQLENLAKTSMSAGSAPRRFSYEVTIPANTAPGTYYLGYILDSGRRVEESSETNNTGFAAITVEAPPDDHGDSRGTATKVELNRSVSGNIETEGDVDYFRFVLTSAGTITVFTTGNTDTYGRLENDSGNYITADGDSGSGKNFSIKRKLDPGTYSIAVSNFLNKETGPYSLRIYFTEAAKLPDLAVDSVRADKRSVVAGESIRVDVRRSNKGDKNSGIFGHGIYLSKDRIITSSDRQLVNLAGASMSAGSAPRRFSYEVTIPANTAPGTYYIGYIVDTGRRIEETDETNNTGYAVITIVAPPVSTNYGDLVLHGSGRITGKNIRHPSGNVFDQVLLTGKSIKLKAKPGHITRLSFMDENEDIVQVEFSGAGTFTVTLDPATFLPAAPPPRYNQAVEYVTGKPSVVIEGADATTFFSIFTVGKINAVNQLLFPRGQVYDAIADVKLVKVINSTGFGGMQLSNVLFSGNNGQVGIDARDVPIAVRLTVGDIDASGSATPYLLFGKGSFTGAASNSGLRITGGDLFQTNGVSIVATSDVNKMISQSNVESDGTVLSAKTIRASFNFIDQPTSNFIPKSLDGKTYRFNYGSFYDDYTFSGHISGTFRLNKTITSEGSSPILASITGTFNLRNDSTSQNTAHLTLIVQTVTLSSEGETLFFSVEQLSSELGEPFPKSSRIEMIFTSPVGGSFSDVTTFTDGFTVTSSGTFEQL